jgi:hypothetical protein
LGVSRDSAYRRLRGETSVSLQEAQVICNHFGVSLQGLFGETGNSVAFDRHGGFATKMEDRLERVNEFLKKLESAKEKELIYFSMELPFFHILQVPDLLAFKLHYWDSMAHPDAPLPRIRLDVVPPSPLYHEVVNRYIRIPSTEIIYEGALSTTMMQILYFLESGNFDLPSDADFSMHCTPCPVTSGNNPY